MTLIMELSYKQLQLTTGPLQSYHSFVLCGEQPKFDECLRIRQVMNILSVEQEKIAFAKHSFSNKDLRGVTLKT